MLLNMKNTKSSYTAKTGFNIGIRINSALNKSINSNSSTQLQDVQKQIDSLKKQGLLKKQVYNPILRPEYRDDTINF